MLLTKTVKLKWSKRLKTWYELKGYKFTDFGQEFEIKVNDLPDGSHTEVEMQCDECDKILKNIKWHTYKRHMHKNGKYYCRECSMKLYGFKNRVKSQLKNGKSFEKWCTDNNRQDILDRWDYELNQCKPSEVCYNSTGFNKKGYWFKCSIELHSSELKSICTFTRRGTGINCTICNTFGQHLIDTYGENALNLYWSDKNKINPFKISKNSRMRVYIKCQNDKKHKDYLIICASFVNGRRCSKCNESKGEKRIEKYLISNKINYISQKQYDGLIGLGCRNLSYDFYLLNPFNLLVEYQGQQHESPIDFKGNGMKKAKENFKIQQEHDRRKNEYAKNHNIKLLEIWYYDFNNIEEILKSQLNGGN